jgi:uncharacterized membrane protein
MKHYLLLYILTLLLMTLVDLAWIGGLMRDFYRSRMPDLEFHAIPGVAFYVIYAAGIVFFAQAGAASWQEALGRGAMFGCFAYATYDLTNLATLRNWSLSLAMTDWFWGTFVTGLASAGGFLLVKLIEK